MSQSKSYGQRPTSREGADHVQNDIVQDAAPSAQAHGVDSDVDAMLSEIDAVLEENAEEFVRSFVQKGGE